MKRPVSTKPDADDRGRPTLRFSELPAVFALVERLQADVNALSAMLRPNDSNSSGGQ